MIDMEKMNDSSDNNRLFGIVIESDVYIARTFIETTHHFCSLHLTDISLSYYK